MCCVVKCYTTNKVLLYNLLASSVMHSEHKLYTYLLLSSENTDVCMATIKNIFHVCPDYQQILFDGQHLQVFVNIFCLRRLGKRCQ